MLDGLIEFFQHLPPEQLWGVQIIFAFFAVLLMLRLFGKAGLFVYIAISIIAANIQVQKLVLFGFYLEPVALGTVLFSTSYLATDILAEYYGAKVARQGVLLGFFASLLWTGMMLLTIGFAPLTPEIAKDSYAWALGKHDHIAAIFTPFPAILLASLCAYLVSQFLDIWIFQTIRRMTKNRFLLLRNNASTLVSGLVDNTIFSTLAFVVLASEPVPFDALVWGFILGTYGIRLMVAFLDTPMVYLAKYFIPRKDRQNPEYSRLNDDV